MRVPRTATLVGAASPPRERSAPVADALALLGSWIGRHRQRRDLGELAECGDRLLRDIGVSRGAALAEAAKPFWRR